MTRSRRRAMDAYVRDLADMLGLRDWRIELYIVEDQDLLDAAVMASDYNHEQAPAVKTAACECVEGQRYAVITIGPNAWREAHGRSDRENLRAAVVHELVHCHLAAVQHQGTRDVGPVQLGQAAYDQFAAAFIRNVEYAVDGLAQAIEPLVPLIRWPQ